MTPRGRTGRWAAWESQTHDPRVQAMIAEAIAERIIRVVPDGEGGIRIISREDGPAPPEGGRPFHDVEPPEFAGRRVAISRVRDAASRGSSAAAVGRGGHRRAVIDRVRRG
jgi:hypothetical protein